MKRSVLFSAAALGLLVSPAVGRADNLGLWYSYEVHPPGLAEPWYLATDPIPSSQGLGSDWVIHCDPTNCSEWASPIPVMPPAAPQGDTVTLPGSPPSIADDRRVAVTLVAKTAAGQMIVERGMTALQCEAALKALGGVPGNIPPYMSDLVVGECVK